MMYCTAHVASHKKFLQQNLFRLPWVTDFCGRTRAGSLVAPIYSKYLNCYPDPGARSSIPIGR